MGVIAIIYESRPNVTSDAAALALKSGSASVLRGGKEAYRSANAIVCALKEGLLKAGEFARTYHEGLLRVLGWPVFVFIFFFVSGICTTFSRNKTAFMRLQSIFDKW